MAEAATTIRIYIKPAQHAKLRELAAIEERSVSWLIRSAIDAYLVSRQHLSAARSGESKDL